MFLTKTWFFIQKHWKLLLLISTTVIGFIFFRGRVTTFAEDYLKIKNIHDEKVKKIDEIRAKEILLKEQNKINHERHVEEIKSESLSKQAALNKEKKIEVDKLIETTKNNPGKLAEEVSKVTGFKVILPKD